MNIRDRLLQPLQHPKHDKKVDQPGRARGTTPLNDPHPEMRRDTASLQAPTNKPSAEQAAKDRYAEHDLDMGEFDRLAGGADAAPPGEWRHVEVDNPDVNEKGAPTIKNDPAAVKAAKSQLSPEQRAQYDQVEKMTRQDPAAHAALEAVLVNGRLTGDPKSSDGKSPLDALAGMAQPGATHPKIDPKKLIGDTVQEIAIPDAIDQGTRGTCVATATQMKLAMDNPAEYARIAAGLAGPDGKVKLASGQELQRVPGTEAPEDMQVVDENGNPTTDADGDATYADTRSTSTRLMSAAFMDYADGNKQYNDVTDRHTGNQYGLFTNEQDHLFQGLGMANANVAVNDGNRAAMMDDLAAKTANGQSVPCLMKWGDKDAAGTTHGNHEILVTKVEGDKVFYNNPWGTQESMSKAEFQSRVLSMAPAKAEAPPSAPPPNGVDPIHAGLLTMADQMDPKSPEYKATLQGALTQTIDDNRAGKTDAPAMFGELAARYEKAGDPATAAVLKQLADPAVKLPDSARFHVLNALRDGKDTKDDLNKALKAAGTSDAASIAVIANAAQARGVDPKPLLLKAVDHRHDGESQAIDTNRMNAIADAMDAHGMGPTAQALRATLAPGVGPEVRERLLNALEDDKSTKGDLTKALAAARTPEERQAIEQVRTLKGAAAH